MPVAMSRVPLGSITLGVGHTHLHPSLWRAGRHPLDASSYLISRATRLRLIGTPSAASAAWVRGQPYVLRLSIQISPRARGLHARGEVARGGGNVGGQGDWGPSVRT